MKQFGTRHFSSLVLLPSLLLTEMGWRCDVTGCMNTSRRQSLYSFPNPSKQNYREPKTYDLALRRREAWITAINRPTFILLPEKSRICSIHFTSGKPARLEDKNHVDWIPTLFMNGTDNDQISKTRARKQNLSATNTEPPPKQSKPGSADSNQEREKPTNPVIKEPVTRKVYSRRVQPVNGVWPRITATIISPESINSPCNSFLLNNLVVQNKSGENVESVSENTTEITVKQEKDTSTAEADDCDLSAAYCFTSKLTEEKATQVTAQEIRRAFQLTASTQTLWK